jgi:LmbE family N-acetylglucosaminyl deacetylase
MQLTSNPRSYRRVSVLLGMLATTVTLAFAFQGGIPAAAPVMPATAIEQQLREFNVLGSVLYIAAHPDDENPQLITYMSRGRHYRAAYLAFTRGDGGQNVMGPEFGEELGVIRTQELLAARRIDGGRQFFTRAIDFGYSKSPDETLRIWDRRQVLSDVVRVIRTFRPDVVITGSSPEPSPGQHGHHTASAILAMEAFKLAGDAKSFPEQLDDLTPWQPKRIFMGRGGRGGSGESAGTLRVDVGGDDPVTGESFSSIAGRSRSRHMTQFGNMSGRGGGGGGGPVYQSFVLAGGPAATNDLMDGVDTTWSRIPGGAEIGKIAGQAVEEFDQKNPAASVPLLLSIRSKAAGLPADTIVDEKRRLLDKIVLDCLGLTVQSAVPQAEVVPGETITLHNTVTVRSAVVPVEWKGFGAAGMAQPLQFSASLRPNQPVSRDAQLRLPSDTALSQPYWLREEAATGLYRVDNPKLIGLPENPPVLSVRFDLVIGGQTFTITTEPRQAETAPQSSGNTGSSPDSEGRRLEVIAPVALTFPFEVRLFSPAATRPVEIEVMTLRPDIRGSLRLEAPAGWQVAPSAQPFRLAKVGDKTTLSFKVTAPAKPAAAFMTAQAEVNNRTYRNARVEIRYEHIPPILLQPTARVRAVGLNMLTRGRRVGYLPGAGDSVAGALEQMGYEVKMLTGADLTVDGLRGLDAVVIGVRAFNVRDDLAAHLPGLFDFVKAGGTVVEQYNRPTGLKTDQFAPYSLRISNDRVTDENAAVTFLAPDHPVLNTPNRITSDDFVGWIQERGIYYPNQWDNRWTAILACSDPGEDPLKGGLLTAQYGEGYFVYTGLVFFRELSAGVPGAYRLFANLVSLGRK